MNTSIMKAFVVYGPMILIAAGLAIWNYNTGGKSLVKSGLSETLKMSMQWAPLIFCMFLLTGQANVLIERHLDYVRSAAGGAKGIWAAVIAGVVTPGGLTSGPIIRKLWTVEGAKCTLIVYFLAANLMNVQLALIRAPMLGKAATIGTGIVGAVVTVGTALVMIAMKRWW